MPETFIANKGTLYLLTPVKAVEGNHNSKNVTSFRSAHQKVFAARKVENQKHPGKPASLEILMGTNRKYIGLNGGFPSSLWVSLV